MGLLRERRLTLGDDRRRHVPQSFEGDLRRGRDLRSGALVVVRGAPESGSGSRRGRAVLAFTDVADIDVSAPGRLRGSASIFAESSRSAEALAPIASRASARVAPHLRRAGSRSARRSGSSSPKARASSSTGGAGLSLPGRRDRGGGRSRRAVRHDVAGRVRALRRRRTEIVVRRPGPRRDGARALVGAAPRLLHLFLRYAFKKALNFPADLRQSTAVMLSRPPRGERASWTKLSTALLPPSCRRYRRSPSSSR